jgi:hypothetical protein
MKPRVVLDTPEALVVVVDTPGGPASRMFNFSPPEVDDHRADAVSRGPAFASLADLRAIGLASDDAGGWRRVRELFPWLWPDPFSFIGRAANEGLR